MLERLWLVHPEDSMCAAFRKRFDGLPGVGIIQGRLEDLEPHDCFVTAGNSFGIMTAGVDAAAVRFFGASLMQGIQHRIMDQFLGEQPVGTAFIECTDLPAYPYVAHAPTMRVPGSIERTDNVYRATWAALLAIHSHNVLSERKIEIAAFPAFGTGFGGMPFEEAARQMAAAYKHYLSPPHRLDWDFVIERQKMICYDGNQKVLD
jgi:O-acetyl-ADP-ribose deacetylase (regulator of RNase III)